MEHLSIAQQSPPTLQSKPRTPAPATGRWSGFSHLLMARMKELKREPEVIFWVFAFPLLLALGLGIAFRNKPADATTIAIVQGPRSADALSMMPALNPTSPPPVPFEPTLTFPPADELVIVPKFSPTRPPAETSR